MRRIVTIFICFIFYITNAQLAKWIVRPKYDHLQLVPSTNIYKGGINDSTFLWNQKGQILLATKYYIGPFKDDVAILSSNNLLKGIINTKGDFVSLESINPAFEINTKYPVFNSGLLLVSQNGNYYYLNSKGEQVAGPYRSAFAFHKNFATVVSYENYEKRKGSIYGLLRNDYSMVHFSLNGKPVKAEDITFITTPNDQQKSLLILKKDVYIYDNNNASIVRLSTDNSTNKKTFVSLPSSDFFIETGNNGNMSITFDKGKAFMDENCVLTKIELNGCSPIDFVKSIEPVKHPESDLVVTRSKDGDSFGIDWKKNDNENLSILPPQFQDVSDCIGINALVCLKDKYGIVQLDSNSSFSLMLNEGKDIGFMHSKYFSSIQASLPDYLSYNDVLIRSIDKKMCEIIPVSRTGADTREGNYLKYNCNLSFPEGINENRSDKLYYFTVEYDGLQSMPIPVKSRVWYIQQYEVDFENQGIENDSVWIQVNVSRRTEPGIDNSYWFNVDLTSEMPISKTLKKVNENVYLFHLANLAEGNHNFSVIVNEDGCPSVSFPFTLKYNPTSKKIAERVIVEKK